MDGHRLLNGISLSLIAGEHLAVVGFSGSGKSTLVQCIGKMFKYSGGRIQIDGREVSDLSKNEIIRDVGYISQHPFIFTGSIEENLLYAHLAVAEDTATPLEPENQIDLDRMILVLQQAGLFVDVMRFGLDSFIDPGDLQTVETIIRIRSRFQENFGAKLDDYVEFYDHNSYHFNSSVTENIVFGTSSNKVFDHKKLPENPKFCAFLQSVGLKESLLALGVELASEAVDILSGLDTIDLFFKNSPVPADKLEKCATILALLKKSNLSSLSNQDQAFLLSLALNFTPAIHTMTILPKELKVKLLTARGAFPKWCESMAPGTFTFYSHTGYIHGQSILNNIFFGKTRPGLPHAQDIINQSIMHLLVEEDYLEKTAAIGMHFQVGTMGDRLSGGQRQKLAIARVLIKQPKIILMDEATSALDNKSQTRIQRLMETRWKGKRTVIAVVHRLDILGSFDKIAVMKAGKLVEFGLYQELIDQKGILHELIYGRK